MKITETKGIMQIEEFGLGEITLTNFGNNCIFEILSTYDGSTIGNIVCEDVKEFICENSFDEEYEDTVFGSFIPLATIKAIDDVYQEKLYNHSGSNKQLKGFLVTIGETDLNIRVVCLTIKVDIINKERYM